MKDHSIDKLLAEAWDMAVSTVAANLSEQAHERMRPFFSVAEAAAYVGVGTDTMRRWIERGSVPAITYGSGDRRMYRVHPGALDAIGMVGADLRDS